ncbi:MAG: polyribonucleotide nucleotidyltransferase, partial [Verrucomicrobiales bacterium]|nr:polyribonucleotide nucleotidyltransferase [Verrucomicrobiales bacterium]
MSIESVTCQVGGQDMKIETGKMGKLADGAVTVQVGETIVMVTAVSQTKVREGQDWFPLSVEYKEKAAAAGRFPGGYFKREGRPTEKEILTCRMTDRPLRPLFPKGYFYDTQIVTLLLSADGVNDADILSMNGASAALAISDIPFAGPIAAVRVGRINGEFVANPTHEQREESDLDLVYAGLRDKVIMIEGAGDEVPDEEFKKALTFAQDAIQPILDAQEELKSKVGKETREYEVLTVKDEVLEAGYAVIGDRIEDAIYA